jgi:hypothetical protein
MGTKAGVGYSTKTESEQAGVEAAKAALDRSGGAACDVAFLYSTAKHDPRALRDGVRSVIGKNAKLLGGATMGIATPGLVSYGGYETGVALFSSDTIKTQLFHATGLPGNEPAVGAALGKQVAPALKEPDASCILLFDSVKSPPIGGLPQINLGSRVLQGFAPEIGAAKLAGHGLLGDSSFSPYYQWYGDEILQNAALALTLSGGVQMDIEVSHGCKPASDFLKVTKSEGNVVFEIDGKPALAYASDLLGPEAGKIEDYPLFLTLGQNFGDKFGPIREENYVNRSVVAVDRDHSALVIAEADIPPGTEVQLMRRSIDFSATAERWQRLYDSVRGRGRRPVLALYFDCAGRSALFANTDKEEAQEACDVLGKHVPLLGVYSGCELTRIGGRLTSLQWTGVLALLSE